MYELACQVHTWGGKSSDKERATDRQRQGKLSLALGFSGSQAREPPEVGQISERSLFLLAAQWMDLDVHAMQLQ